MADICLVPQVYNAERYVNQTVHKNYDKPPINIEQNIKCFVVLTPLKLNQTNFKIILYTEKHETSLFSTGSKWMLGSIQPSKG